MANWLVSSHGGVPSKGGFWRLIAPTAKFKQKVTTLPLGIEVVMYTSQAQILSMDFGWWLWYALMYGENGGEQAAYNQKHKVKKNLKIVPNYRTYGDDWVDNRGTWACGLYEVGDPTHPIETWSSATRVGCHQQAVNHRESGEEKRTSSVSTGAAVPSFSEVPSRRA